MGRGLVFSILVVGIGIALPARSQTFSRTDVIQYHDDLNKWTIGQAKSSTNSNTGVVEWNIDFDSLTAKPWRVYLFGDLRQTIGYNADGTIQTLADGKNNTTTLTSWKRGIPQNIQYADGSARSAGVDDYGWIRSLADERGSTTRYDYDSMGRLSLIDYPDLDDVNWMSTVVSFAPVSGDEYGISAGHWRQTIATGSGRKETYFDAMWRPLLVREYDATDVVGTQRFTAFGYDHEGRKIFEAYPLASVGTVAGVTKGVRTTYDALGRVTKVAQDSELGVLNTYTEYLQGGQVRVTNPRQQQTTTSYLAYDEPTDDWPVSISHPEGTYTDIARDVFGKPTSITRRNADGSLGLIRGYAYDGYQQLCKSAEPETGATLMGYDDAGNLTWSASGLPGSTPCEPNGTSAAVAARKATRTYDARNRLSTLAFPDGNGNQRWTYWPNGLTKQITTANAGITTYNSYAYNMRGLLASESQGHADGETWAMGYGYDTNGNLAAHRYPSGQTVAYTPNALGQPTQAGSYATGVSYYPNGTIHQFTYGNSIVHTMAQNDRQLPDVSEDAYGGTAFLSDGYDYDANGNVAAISDGATGRNQRGNRTMAYDGLDRLTSTVSPMFGTATYGYDVLDNLTRVVAPGRDHYYCYDGSWRLTNIKTGGCSGTTVIGLGFDVQGNLKNKNGQGFVFDYGNRLREATGKESYRYDGYGRRTQAVHTTGRIGSMYDQGGVLRYQKNQRESKTTDYITLGGSLVAEADWPLGQTVPAKDYVNWTAVGGAVSYVVEESVDGVTWASVYEGTDVSWTSLARPTGTYSYRVLACTAAGVCTPITTVAHVQRPAFNIVPILYELLLN